MKYTLVSIDLAKDSFQFCGINSSHKVVINQKMSRNKLLQKMATIEPTTVVMEACYSSNPWGRKIESFGHTVKLIPAYQVKPFLIGNKNDKNDAVAIAEASKRPTISIIPVKTLAQQDVQSLQRIRERLVKHRAAVSNQCRGLLSEYFIVVDKKIPTLLKSIPGILEEASNDLSVSGRRFIQKLADEIRYLSQEIKETEQEILELLKDNVDYRRLLTVPGIGPVTATAFMASVNVNQFKNGRQLSAWIGITPKQHASGPVNKMGSITKRGNSTIRQLLIHGARSIVKHSDNKTDPFSQWINQLKKRMHANKVNVAVANKLARMAWAMLSKRVEYSPFALTKTI
jgi:transposase